MPLQHRHIAVTLPLQDRIGSTGNQFAISTLLGTVAILPFWLATEAKNWGTFVELFKTVRLVTAT